MPATCMVNPASFVDSDPFLDAQPVMEDTICSQVMGDNWRCLTSRVNSMHRARTQFHFFA